MPNGKHNAQQERYAAQVKQHGGEKPVLDWNEHGGLVGFEYDGRLFRAKVKPVASAASMEQRMLHRATIFIGLLQMLAAGDTLHIPSTEWKPRR